MVGAQLLMNKSCNSKIIVKNIYDFSPEKSTNILFFESHRNYKKGLLGFITRKLCTISYPASINLS